MNLIGKGCDPHTAEAEVNRWSSEKMFSEKMFFRIRLERSHVAVRIYFTTTGQSLWLKMDVSGLCLLRFRNPVSIMDCLFAALKQMNNSDLFIQIEREWPNSV